MGIKRKTVWNSPQADDDFYWWTEDELLALDYFDQSTNIITLDVMANDAGGNSKSLYSIDDGDGNFLQDMLDNNVNTGWEETAEGNRIQIVNGKVEFDIGYSLSFVGGSIDGLAANEFIEDTFTYSIQLGNGTLSWATVTVRIDGVNDAPEITSGASASVDENTTAVMTVTSEDPDYNDTALYSIVGGADQFEFNIDSNTGDLTFAVAPNLEVPGDADGDNVYDVTVQVDDLFGGTDTQAIAVTVTNVNEAPEITSNGGGATASVNVDENQTGVTTVTSTDVDGGAPIYTISGADAGLFSIDGAGVLTFNDAPDFEDPLDAGGDNIYDVTVQVADGLGGTDTQAIAVTVDNVDEQGPTDAPNDVIDEAVDSFGFVDDTTFSVNRFFYADVLDNNDGMGSPTYFWHDATTNVWSGGDTLNVGLGSGGNVSFIEYFDTDGDGQGSFDYEATDGVDTYTATVTLIWDLDAI